MDAPLLERARQLLAAGPWDARAAEIAAVHAALYPQRDAVCQTCPRELGPAFFAIKRWVAQQGAADDAPTSFLFMNKTTARFKSDTTIYTPHGLGVAYSNLNLTDKAARDILAADPDAARLFDVLPPAADGADASDSAASASAAKSDAAPAEQPAPVVPAGFDYAKLASAMVDELERRQSTHEAVPATVESTTPTLTASPGGLGADAGKPAADSTSSDSSTSTDGSSTNNGSTAGDNTDGDSPDGDRPVRLSRMNKDQLVAAHTTELGQAPAPELTNDEMRAAISQHRAGQSNAE